MNATKIKSRGIHYTPPELAEFLAGVTVEHLGTGNRHLSVLDPACGDGALLSAFARAIPWELRDQTTLVGYETDAMALAEAAEALNKVGAHRIVLRVQDFLAVSRRSPPPAGQQLSLLADGEARMGADEPEQFDAVIANPPYVRTQVLGAKRAQELARQFGLTGRVDLYHAFSKGMARVLKPGGILGLLTSNRFLTIKSGSTLRHLLRREFSLRAIYDLGDTKLFSAAVLPVIVVAQKATAGPSRPCSFDRVYEHRSSKPHLSFPQERSSVISAMRDRSTKGLIKTPSGQFHIERGELLASGTDDVWTLSTPLYAQWLKTLRQKQVFNFGEVAFIRVGIKTTADDVFIKDQWNTLPTHEQPECDLVHPLIRHTDAGRWIWTGKCRSYILYPHTSCNGKRTAIDLARYPRTRNYLELHRERLTSRKYVIDGGRKWYELWVPHDPAEWSKEKIVFPDISEEPRFFFDDTGAIVNGDCYWITLRPGFDRRWLLMMLAIANSTVITRYYDIAFHNKLYSGRRRFMTQYVQNFPLPAPDRGIGQEIIQLADRIVNSTSVDARLEKQIDGLVWQAFGLVKEI